MAWKFFSADLTVEVIVTTTFDGDLLSLARQHPIWIVESDHNSPRIDAVWAAGREEDLFEVSRVPWGDKDSQQAFIDLLPTVFQHHNWSELRYKWLIVRGAAATDEVRALLEISGFLKVQSTPDGFAAEVHPDRDFATLGYV